MAINVNTVYRTVLLILNKEQRGYMTPDEFNKIGTQVQREIFERYFEDLNQQSRLSQNDVDYANRLELTEEKLQEFKTYFSPAYVSASDDFAVPTDLYKLGNITYRKANYYNSTSPAASGSLYSSEYKELQRVNRHDFNLIRKSRLVTPSKNYGVFLYEGDRIRVYPQIATQDNQTPIELDYLKKPDDVRWGYLVGGLGQFLYDSTSYNGSSLILNEIITTGNGGLTGATPGTYAVTIPSATVTTSGSGTGVTATLTISPTGTFESLTINSVGSGFAVNDTINVLSTGTWGGSGSEVITITSSNLMSNSAQGSTNFLLHNSEQAEVVLNILLYAGVVIRDPQAVQTAMAQVQKEEANEKQ